MDLLPLARLALATLRGALDFGLRAVEKNEQVPSEVQALAEKSLLVLDLYLTGLSGGSCRRERELRGLWEGERMLVHLSDGGYSRLTLDLFGDHGPVLGMDRALSTTLALKRWDVLCG